MSILNLSLIVLISLGVVAAIFIVVAVLVRGFRGGVLACFLALVGGICVTVVAINLIVKIETPDPREVLVNQILDAKTLEGCKVKFTDNGLFVATLPKGEINLVITDNPAKPGKVIEWTGNFTEKEFSWKKMPAVLYVKLTSRDRCHESEFVELKK